ncbi:hypothetical protein [Gemmatimonas aurantiaca]|uniref:hypothetical protein n=1 Tax=Gemmatimonas aurantiaca TaxID=173480 RepID=UPI00301D2526
MIVFLGDVHDLLGPMHAMIHRLPPHVDAIVQVGDLWVWPEDQDIPPMSDGSRRALPPRPMDASLRWQRPAKDLYFLDGNHHLYPLTRGLTAPTCVAPGAIFLPRGSVLTLPGKDGPLRVGVLGGADSLHEAMWRTPDRDWWPDEERVTVADVDRLLANVTAAGGIDLLVTHTPPASIVRAMHPDETTTVHPSAELVEHAWRALGGGVSDPPVELICGHMHAAWTDRRLRVEVLAELGLAVR